MVALAQTETDYGVRWLGYLILSVLANIAILSVIDLSRKADPLIIPMEFKISFSSVAKSAQKVEAVQPSPKPIQEITKPIKKVVEPIPAPPPPAPIAPVAEIVTKEVAPKVITLKQEAAPIPEPVQEIAKSEEPPLPIPMPRIKPKLKPLVKPEPKPQIAQKPKPAEPVKPMLEEQLVAALAPEPAKPVESLTPAPEKKPAQDASDEILGDDGEGLSTVVGKPSYKRKGQPRYPPRALDMGQQGEVKLHVLVARDGKPKELKIAKSSGYRLLDKAALAAVKKWEFIPKRKGAVAVASWVAVPVNFVLR